MRSLLRLFRWRRRPRLHSIGEAEAYARSYGERTEDVLSVERIAPPPEPEPEPESEPELAPSEPATVSARSDRPRGRISDAMLRSAFAARLAARSGRHT
jgi:hypothetical protein